MEKSTLAAEIISDLKRINNRRRRIIVLLSAIILLLTAMVIASPRMSTPVKVRKQDSVKLNEEFTTAECEFFRRECNFTDEELGVFNLRVKGKTNVEVALKLCMSESTVDRRVKAIKKKIIRVL